MRTYLTTFLIVIAAAAAAACGGGVTENANTGTASANKANSNANANGAGHPLVTTRTPEPETTNNAPTLGPVVQAYYSALEKKDDAAVRETLASGFVRTLDADMKAEKKTNLAAYLAETDYQPGLKVEVRNERIEGDKAVAEIRGGVYKNWTPLAFVKESGKWKLSNDSPALTNVDQSGTAKQH
ncbi:MAG: hypothetical protein ACK4S4_08710 [Pyrinomonadaceae bacterium]